MGQRTPTSDRPTVRLIVRKETVRRLRTLSEDELRAANGAVKDGPPPPRPSAATC